MSSSEHNLQTMLWLTRFTSHMKKTIDWFTLKNDNIMMQSDLGENAAENWCDTYRKIYMYMLWEKYLHNLFAMDPVKFQVILRITCKWVRPSNMTQWENYVGNQSFPNIYIRLYVPTMIFVRNISNKQVPVIWFNGRIWDNWGKILLE